MGYLEKSELKPNMTVVIRDGAYVTMDPRIAETVRLNHHVGRLVCPVAGSPPMSGYWTVKLARLANLVEIHEGWIVCPWYPYGEKIRTVTLNEVEIAWDDVRFGGVEQMTGLIKVLDNEYKHRADMDREYVVLPCDTWHAGVDIRVTLNGKEVDLKTISQETWKRLRGL